MVLRSGWMLALGLALAPAPGFGQAPTSKPSAANPARQTGTSTQVTVEPVTRSDDQPKRR